MEIFSTEELYKDEIDNIWNDVKFQEIDVIRRGYGIHDKIIKNSILFIGINPSFSGKNLTSNKYFINIDQTGKSYPYFKKFKDISESVNHTWTHFDLLYFRETQQKFISELLKKEIGVEFIYKQLQISKKVILQSKPKVIVVSNTMSRYFMGFNKNKENNTNIWMGFEFVFDEDLGTHKITNHVELENVPVFFTSMLTGQRALDNGSYERLIWHIKYVLKKISTVSQ